MPVDRFLLAANAGSKLIQMVVAMQHLKGENMPNKVNMRNGS